MKNTIVSSIAFLVLALTAPAAVITQTVNFGTVTGEKGLSFSQFNTALGTLTGVTLSWTVNSSISSAFITNQNAGTVNVSRISFTNTVEGYLFASSADDDALAVEVAKSKSVTPAGGTKTLTSGQTYNAGTVTFTGFTQTDSYATGDDNFNAFKGTGQVPIYLTNTFGATPTASGSGSTTAWLTSITGSSTGNLEVTYNYTAAIAPVPEPSAMILGCGGLFFMGAFAVKKKRKATADSAPVITA